ncbi:hypothetical protein BDW62DRAFT_8581 [Aspergillus aurantiobrunneus]
MPASDASELSRGFDRAVLTYDRLPERGEACLGMAVNDSHITMPCTGKLRIVFRLPVVVWVQPTPDQEALFVDCTKADIYQAVDQNEAPSIKDRPWSSGIRVSRVNEKAPKVGDQALGWWRNGRRLMKGVGQVEQVHRDALYYAVKPFKDDDDRHFDHFSPGLWQELLDETRAKLVADIAEARIKIVKRTVRELHRAHPTGYLEDVIRNGLDCANKL